MTLTCFVDRGHNPRWAFAPDSGQGAAATGGRFSPVRLPALYTSRRFETAWLEAQQAFPFKAQPMTLCAYAVDCADVLDLTDPPTLAAHGIDPANLACAWKDLSTRGIKPPTWLLAERLTAGGTTGIIVPSFAKGTGAGPDGWCDPCRYNITPGQTAHPTPDDAPMGLLLAFTPFILFTVLNGLAGPLPGLAAGTLVAAALLLRDAVTAGRTPKILDIGSTLLFGGLALYTVLTDADWSAIAVRLCVEAGLLLIVVVSLALGRPFTLQYARDQVSENLRHHPIFIRTNVVVTRAWAVAFAVMALAEAALLALPSLPPLAGIGVVVLALAAAVTFTMWYPKRVSARRRI